MAHIVDLIDEIKEKLTSQEYKNIMDQLPKVFAKTYNVSVWYPYVKEVMEHSNRRSYSRLYMNHVHFETKEIPEGITLGKPFLVDDVEDLFPDFSVETEHTHQTRVYDYEKNLGCDCSDDECQCPCSDNECGCNCNCSYKETDNDCSNYHMDTHKTIVRRFLILINS